MPAALLGAWTPVSDHNPIPAMLSRKLAANEQVGKGQFATVSPTTGLAALASGTVPNQIALGNGDFAELSDKSATAGAAEMRASERWFYGLAMGTSTDAFTDADYGVPFWIKDSDTLGKLSNLGGSNRSMGGLVFGLARDGTPLAWSGPIAHLLARATHVSDNEAATCPKAADAAASTATAETVLPRKAIHGPVTAVTITPSAALTADATNNATLTISKRDGAGGGAVVVATLVTDVAGGSWTAFVPKAFTLSAVAGALNLLETDVLTLTIAKGGTGVVVPASAIRIAQKAI